MFYKVKSVEALGNFILLITFENNTKKYYNVANLFDKFPIFKELVNISRVI